MTYQNISVVTYWISSLQTPDSSSDSKLSGFSSSQFKKNSSGFTRILNQSPTQPIYQKRCIL